MKRLGTGLILLVVIVAGAAFLLPAVIPASAYRDRVETAASDALSREVSLAGDVRLTLLPRVEVRASDVAIANAEGFGAEPFAEMTEMRVGVRLIPLLSRRVEITEFVLVEPTIRLEQRGGANNWTFASDGTAAAPASSGTGFVRRPGALPIEASFGDVRIENAAIHYSDGTRTRSITGLDVAVQLPSLDERTMIDGTLSADGEAMSFNAELGSVRDFFEGRATPLALSLGGNLLDVRFDGEVPASEGIELAGGFSADIPSIRALAAFAGADLPPGDRLRRFSARGQIAGRPDRLSLTAQSIRLDDIAGSGNLTATLGGARPRLTGRLDLPALDVTPYLPEPAGQPAGGGGGVPPWSEAPIDLAGLGIVDANLDLAVGTLQFRDITVTDAALNVLIENARLTATLQRFTLYEGQGNVTVVANARSATPSYSLQASLSGLDALPFLEAAAGFERLAGTGTMGLNFTASGASQAAIMRSLDGSGNFNFADGAIVGINIAQTIRNVSGFLDSRQSGGTQGETDTSESDSERASVGETQTTDFTSLGGTFNIVDGRVTNQDLLMLSPLLRLEGTGWVDLAEQTLDYRLRPRAVATIEGQGGTTDLRGVVVPIRFQGGFNSVRYGVDTEAVAQALVRGALSNALGGDRSQSPEDVVRNSLMDAIGLGQPSRQEGGDEATEEEADPAEQLLRGLLNQSRSRSQTQDSEDGGDPNRG
ncbi:AsmA family protein [Maricaulis sp.]|uniref:AsmA family protein n=1 Tax=Maricaulis sp. TaxID=1486257 RepID=UPI00262618A0|nr:AsmA family protein [Maricaulis sp.]